MKFKNQKIVIIGGSSGIGLATAQYLSSQGANLLLGARDIEKLKDAQKSIKGNVEIATIDVTDSFSIKSFFDNSGKFNHIFISGASPSFTPFVDVKLETGKAEFGGKFWGQFEVIQHSVPNLLVNGSAVLMSGGYSLRPESGTTVMAAANGAIEALVRALAVEHSPLRFNSVAPGLVDTPLIHFAVPTEYREPLYQKMRETLLTKRVALADDIASGVSFLMENPHITGSTLRLDGGTSLF